MRRRTLGLLLTALVVPALVAPGPDEPASDRERVDALIGGLREAGKAKLADTIRDRFDRAARELAPKNSAGHTIHGRVVLEGPDDPKKVQAQMLILEDGYFVGTVGQAGQPVGFRLHGFEPVDVLPAGRPGSIEDVGTVYLRRLDESRMASLKGKVVLEGQPDVPEAKVGLSLATGPINSATGGYEGQRGLRIPPIAVAPDGTLAGSGYVPAEHQIYVKAPGYWLFYRPVDFQPGQTLDLGTVRLDLADRVTVTSLVARGPSFAEATSTKITADGAGGWKVAGRGREEYLMFLHRPDGNAVRLRSSHGPFELADLGEGSIEEMAKADHSGVRLGPDRAVLAESGHVYLGRWRASDLWVLFHLKREKMTPEEARQLKLD